MIKSYFVDGDKGGVGKSFVSRCLVDSFINHEVSGMPKIDKLIVIDADPMNPDVVCDNGYKNEAVNNIQVIGLQRPIKSEDDWLNLINELAETQINEADEIRLIFSLPSAAGLYITESILSLMALMNPTPIWVMGIDASSTNQLEARVGKSPMFYQNGLVLINLKHGPGKSFEFWNKSSIRKSQLTVNQELTALDKVPKFSSVQGQLRSYDPEQVWRAADASLQAAGLIPSRLHGRYCDVSDQKPVYKLLVSNDGLATAFSFRSDIDLPAPWREGRPTSDGKKTMFVTGRDLGLDGDLAPPRSSPALPRPVTAAESHPVDLDLNQDTVKSWMAAEIPPADHRHLVKSNAVLNGSDLRVYPRDHRFTGTLMAPMFRPDPMGRPGMVELCGVQNLMAKVAFSTDKIMAKGSRTIGAFVPLPAPNSLMQAITGDSLAPIQAWLAVADKDKPLVICEGVATGLAIQQSGAGSTLCALSSNNVMGVAKWVKKTGLSDLFPSVVIATDHDIGRDAAGRLKSNAIPRALEAAKDTGFVLAVPAASCPTGADARDLLGQGGPQAVRDYIASAAPAADVEKARPDIFLALRENRLPKEAEFER